MSETDVLSPEKHRQILDGAAEAFAQDGYEGASMSRIAACAGVSKGTLYNYFDGKAELFAALIADTCKLHLAHVFDIAHPDGDPAAALQAIGERMVDLMLSEVGLTIHRLVLAESGKFPALARVFYEAGPARGRAFMAAWLARQADAGRLHIDDPAFAADQFLTLCQTRIVMERRLGLAGPPSREAVQRVVHCAVAMFLNTYGAPP